MKTYLNMSPTLLLYLGGVLAGWAGGGWNALVPLLLAFLLWHVVMRPQDWSRTAGVGIAFTAVVQLGLVMLCLMIGRGLAWIWPLPLPVWAGVWVAILATPLQRALVDPVKAAAMDRVMDDMLLAIDGLATARSVDESTNAARLKAERNAAEAALTDALRLRRIDFAILSQSHALHLLFAVVSDLKATGTLPPDLVNALISYTCDPCFAIDLQGQDGPFFAFGMVQDDPAALERFARACTALLQAEPAAYWDCPSNAVLRLAQRRYAGTGAATALHDLRYQQICLIRARLARDRAEALAETDESIDNPAP